MAALVALLNAPVHVEPTCAISKSRYVAGIQCLKRLYLQVHSPEFAVLGDQARAVMAQGTEVGVLARGAFPGGVLVASDREHLAEAIRHTRELLSNREVPAIYEATFEYHGVLVRVDILERCGEAFRLIEVKSTTEIRPQYSHDVGIQRYVAEGNGIRIASACVMHLNRKYVFDGRKSKDGNPLYDLSQLFAIEEIETTPAAFISRQLSHVFAMLAKTDPPEIAPGEQCMAPYQCEFYRTCNPEWPQGDVRSLPITKWKIDALRQRGFYSTGELPDPFSLRELYHLTEKECMMAVTAKEKRMRISPGLAVELATIRFPVCYLDFESLWPALPWFPGMRPYDHIVYQWSAVLQQYPCAPLIRSEFLWERNDDPRVPFVESLLEVLVPAGTIIVYNQSFEASRLEELAKWLPQYESALRDARRKLWDLLPVIRRNLYDPSFGGSYSLKRVLPALLPGSGYEGLEVPDGSHAGLAWVRLLSTSDSMERLRLRNALLEYCGQDAAALGRIVTLLIALAKSRQPCS